MQTKQIEKKKQKNHKTKTKINCTKMSINTVTAQPRNKFGDLGKQIKLIPISFYLYLSRISHISAFIFQINQINDETFMFSKFFELLYR